MTAIFEIESGPDTPVADFQPDTPPVVTAADAAAQAHRLTHAMRGLAEVLADLGIGGAGE